MKKKETVVDNSLSEALGIPNEIPGIAPAVTGLSMYSNSPAYLITMQPYLLSNAYKTYGVLQTAIDQPVLDGFSGGIKFESSTLSPEELEDLQAEMAEQGDFEIAQNVIRWQRLYGGGICIANTKQDSKKPLNKGALKGRDLQFIASDRWECIGDELGALSQQFDYHGNLIDKSRVFTSIGKQPPYYVRLRLQGWGLSLYEQMLADIVKFFKAQNVALELLDEAKIDVLKIFDLSQTLALPGGVGESRIRKRVEVAAKNKNYKSMLAIDSKDEYEQKQINLNGIAPLQQEIRLMMCASVRMPEQKLYGVGSGGFSDDDGIIETYNKLIEAEIRTPSKRMIKWMAQLRCWQMFGREVPDLDVVFDNLRELSRKEEVELNTREGEFILSLKQAGILTNQEVMQALQQKGIFTMKTKALDGLMDDVPQSKYGDMLDDIETDNR